VQKCCILCKKREFCSAFLRYNCKVWGGIYEDEVVDLLLFEPKGDKAND
jgi:hypothetical protein